MKLNEKKFFELAKQNGFEAADINFTHSRSLSCSIFRGEVDSYSENETYGVIGRGIVNGKFGSATTEKIDKNTPEFLINSIKESARLVEKEEPSIIYKGSEKYHKKNVYNPEALSGNIPAKIKVLLEIEQKLKAFDKRINEVATVGYDESFDENIMSNSYGLKLKDKLASYSYYAEITAVEGEETKTGFKVFASMDPNEFNVDKFVEEVAKDALNKLGSTQCASKKYPVVLNPRTTSMLLKAYMSNMNAEEVQKKSSMFVNKLHQPIASKKLTVIEDPLQKNLFFCYHDDEGVATKKATLINKGVLETYLYTLQTAAQEGIEPTGHGMLGAKVVAGLHYFYVKPGKKSFDEMIKDIKEGVFITELEGMHAGMNAKSGNFSLQAQGFMIRDGKISEPLSLITLAGNLSELFMSVKDVANDSEFLLSGCSSPSIYIKKLAVSGK